MPRALFWVSVNGTEIQLTLLPILIRLEMSDTDGGQADTLEIELDDEGGMIALPPTNAPISAGLGWEGSGAVVQFEGKVDQCSSALSRGGGLVLTISAKSVDMKGKPKEHRQKHHDKGKLSEVAKKFGKDAGLDVDVGKGIDVERDYWAMQGESFLNWSKRIASEVGATVKVRGGKMIFAERSAGKSAGGQSLATVTATRPGNVISGQMTPAIDRQDWQKFQTRWYDKKKAKWNIEDAEARGKGGSVKHLDGHAHADKESAKKRSGSNSAEAERDKGGGTITIDGEPTAQAEAMCVVSGYRPGIDGQYRIKTARHRLTRGDGFTTELELVAPGGEAGSDSRGSGGSGK